jgi:hypothetical protein
VKRIDVIKRLGGKPAIGLVALAGRSRVFVEHRLFDLILGVSTSGSSAGAGENMAYERSPWLSVRGALRDLSPSPSDVFVDLGSGKGKVLLIAGRLPYHRVVGVEIDPELSRTARRNVQRARNRLLAKEIGSATANVLEWVIPDDSSVIFLFNPFIGQTFHAMMHRIFDSYDREPRMLHIVYLYPWEHDWLLSTGRTVVRDVRPAQWPTLPRWWMSGKVIVTYRVVRDARCFSPPEPGRRRQRSEQAMSRWTGVNGHRFGEGR